jgi:DNA-binding winged helix-turn-helix (wHTH) protein/predicted ATPase/class 3 adenylate cyclase
MPYHFGAYSLDAEAYELRRQGERLALEPKGVQVLHYLIQQRDRVVPHDELFAQCWPGTFVSDWALTRCLARIRKALGDGRDGTRIITTVRGQGYRFVAPLTEVPRTATPSAGAAQEPLPPAPGPLPLSLSPLLSGAPDGLAPLPPTPRRPAEAERRVLTILCCALVNARASRRDPEEVQAVVQDYHRFCTEVIHGLGGTIAHYLPNEVIAYFGYPQAHEDDARRGTRAGLLLVATLGAQVAGATDHAWAVRGGVHTGLVVVGEPGDNRPGLLAVGETPALAARLKDCATPGTVVISAATARLVEGYFSWEETPLPLHAAEDAVSIAYQVVGEQAVQSRLEVETKRGLTPFIGRDAELSVLHTRWAEVTAGLGQVVVLTGEPGIGKSRLVQTLTAHLAAAPHGLLEWRCSPYHQHSPWYPVIAQLHRWLQWHPDEPPEAKLQRLEAVLAAVGLPVPDAVPLLAALLALPLPATYPPLTLAPQRQKQRTLDLLLAWLFAETAQHPVLLIVEDLHWSDPSTLELLTLLIDHGPTARLLTLLTSRPEFQSPWTPRAHVTYLPLGRLPRRQVEEMIGQVSGGKALPPVVVGDITAKTDGVPLFVEELTVMVLESGVLQEGERDYTLTGPLPPLAIPTTLQGVLLARLDRLQPAKTVAQLGATMGRTFAYALLQAIASLDEAALQQGLRQLVEAELVYQQGVLPTATYTFKHALIQDAAYHSLLRSTRQQTHQRIAQALAERFPELIATQPELLAYHYTEAGLPDQALPYWQRAGQQASDRSAYLEAVSHFTTGIALLQTLPATPAHLQATLLLYIALGAALQMAKGNAAPEVERAYTQARVLCQQVGETPQLVPVLRGLWRFYIGQPQLQTAREIGDTLLRLAQRAHDPALAVIAHSALGWTWFYLGALPVARRHIEAAMAHDTPDQRQAPAVRIGFDPSVGCRLYAAVILWFLGYPAQALARLHEALALARALAHPLSLAFAQWWAAWLAQLRRDVPAVSKEAEAAIALVTEQGLTLYEALGTILQGWALAMQGQGGEGLAQVRQGIAAYRATGAGQAVPLWGILLAEVSAHLGHIGAALQTLAEAITLLEQQEERMWEAEAYRLRGALLLRQSGTQQAEAEAWLQRALHIARRQEAKSLELRAATSLARLWQQQSQQAAARELLTPIYGWFTEGFDTADLQEARALLTELS